MSQLTATSTKTLERVYAKAEVEHLRDAAERASTGGARNWPETEHLGPTAPSRGKC